MMVKQCLNHFKLVCTHKKYVFEACCEAGIPLQGLLHDLSKFSPTEFLESVKWYSGDRSPIDNCKDAQGYSMAWFHHRGRNKHHWEYWVDNFQDGMTPTLMPFKYALEMLCDFIGAGKAYLKDKFTWEKEWEWWKTKRELVVMHPVVWHFINMELSLLRTTPNYKLNYKECQLHYTEWLDLFKEGRMKGEWNSQLTLKERLSTAPDL